MGVHKSKLVQIQIMYMKAQWCYLQYKASLVHHCQPNWLLAKAKMSRPIKIRLAFGKYRLSRQKPQASKWLPAARSFVVVILVNGVLLGKLA